VEGARHRGARARTGERSGSPSARRDARTSSHRPHARFGSRGPGEDRRADRGRAGADRAASRVCGRRRSRPKGEALTSIDTERFREALTDERRRVEHALATLRHEHPGSLDDEVEEVAPTNDNHLAETASATLGREIDYTLGDNAEQVISEIDGALKRIDEGTYGTCVNCGGEIPVLRLEANPWASLCIDCKRRAEGG
jgi:DnaK suppressor protein